MPKPPSVTIPLRQALNQLGLENIHTFRNHRLEFVQALERKEKIRSQVVTLDELEKGNRIPGKDPFRFVMGKAREEGLLTGESPAVVKIDPATSDADLRENFHLMGQLWEYLISFHFLPSCFRSLMEDHELLGADCLLLMEEVLLLGALLLTEPHAKFSLKPVREPLSVDQVKKRLVRHRWPWYLGEKSFPVHGCKNPTLYTMGFHDLSHYAIWKRRKATHRTDSGLLYDCLKETLEGARKLEGTDLEQDAVDSILDRCLVGPTAYGIGDFYKTVINTLCEQLFVYKIDWKPFLKKVEKAFRHHPREKKIKETIALFIP
jgi:hypothetical protein